MSIREDLNSSKDAPSQAHGIAFCDVFMLTLVVVVAGNLHVIILFAKNVNICRKHLFRGPLTWHLLTCCWGLWVYLYVHLPSWIKSPVMDINEKL